MELVKGIKERRSTRKFTDQAVSEDDIREIVATAAYAPSWKNTQTSRYIAVVNPEKKQEIADTCVMGFAGNQRIIGEAPVLIVETTVNERSGYERDGSFSTSKGTHWQSYDAGLAGEAFCLAAWEKGLGTVIMGIFEEEKYQKFLQGNLELSNEELNILISDEFHDKSLFFKSCPFVEDGVGCTIPFQFRNPVCNFFLCHEIKNNAHDDKLIKEYENEAESFWKFYDWENMNLTHLLHENNLNLLKDFHKTLKFLANYEISYYDFPPLAEMDLHTEESSTNFIK